MALGDKVVKLEGLKAVNDHVQGQVSGLVEAVGATTGYRPENLFTAAVQYTADGTTKNISKTSGLAVSVDGNVITYTPSGNDQRFGNTTAAGGNFYTQNANWYAGYPIPCAGMKQLLFVISNANDVFKKNYVTFYDADGVSLGASDKIAAQVFTRTVPEGAAFAAMRIGSDTAVSGTAYTLTVGCYGLADSAPYSLNEVLEETRTELDANARMGFRTYPGALMDTGAVNAPSDTAQEVYTNLIPVHNGSVIDISFTLTAENNMWAAYALYDDRRNFISRTNVITSQTGKAFSKSITVTEATAAFLRFSYRTYGAIEVVIQDHTAAETLFRQIPDESLVHYENQMVKVVNHRGYCLIAPENTLPAFRLSRQRGFKYVETDVALTSDGIPVLLHDQTINRTARDANGNPLPEDEEINIHDITYEQALTYDFGRYKGPEYAGTKIPTLEQFFALCRGLGLYPMVELKSTATYTEAQVQGIVDIAKRYGMADKVSWISFSKTYLEYVRDYDSKARLGYLCESPGDTQIATIKSLRTGSNEVFASCHYTAINNTGAGKCIAEGIPLAAWTLDAYEPNDSRTYKQRLLELNPYVTSVSVNSYDVAQVLYWANMAD